MKVVEFLSYLNSLDIKLWLEGEKLRYQAPKGVMTPEIKEEIAAKKPEILDFLKSRIEINYSYSSFCLFKLIINQIYISIKFIIV